MKRPGLIVATITTVLLAGIVLYAAGWFSHSAEGQHLSGRTDDSCPAWQHQPGKPHNWRDLLMKR